MDIKNFAARRHYVYHEQLLNSTPDKIFPLLCPKREYEWIETWKCDILFSNSGFAELDCVFNTEFPGDVKETWVVDKFDKDKNIQFIRFSDIRVMRYCISLFNNNNGTTSAKWELIITSLNTEGNIYIEKFSDVDFANRVKALEKMLNHYLAKGEMFRTTILKK
jgi:hypothetical protein